MPNLSLAQQIKNCEKSINNIYKSLQNLIQEIETAYPQLPEDDKTKKESPRIRFIYPDDCTKKVLERLLYRQVAVPARISGSRTKYAHYHANRIRGKPEKSIY